jgi:hypothetical protein
LPELDHSASESNLERFLSDLEGALDGVPRNVLGETGVLPGAWPRWVLRPGEPGMGTVTAAGSVGPDRSAPILDSDPAPSAFTTEYQRSDVALSDLRGLDWESPQPQTSSDAVMGRLGWVGLLFGALTIATLLVGSRAARKRSRAARSRPPHSRMPTIAGPHSTVRSRASKSLGFSRASKSLGLRTSRVHDLPPWLTGPS